MNFPEKEKKQPKKMNASLDADVWGRLREDAVPRCGVRSGDLLPPASA